MLAQLLGRRSSTLMYVFVVSSALFSAEAEENSVPRKYVRFAAGDLVSYGVLEGDKVRRLSGNPFGNHTHTDTVYPLNEVRLLVPTTPSKVLALAGNYKDHLGDSPLPENPEPFYKPPSCLQRHGGDIVLHGSTTDIHYEAEMVLVIGRRAKRVAVEDALDYVFGITCGNDVSARIWQNDPEVKDTQWWRAKGADTFGPCGPFIATGLDYNNLGMQLRVNGGSSPVNKHAEPDLWCCRDSQLHQSPRDSGTR